MLLQECARQVFKDLERLFKILKYFFVFSCGFLRRNRACLHGPGQWLISVLSEVYRAQENNP